MTRWVRWGGLLFFLAVFLLWLLSIDWLIKRGIEKTGSNLLNARVELQGVDLELLSGVLRLSELQVANEEKPMSNLFQAQEILLEIDTAQLLLRRVIVESAEVTGLQLNTPRKYSGAIRKKEEVDQDLPNESFQLPTLAGFDTNKLYKTAEENVNSELDEIKNELKNIEEQWKTRIEQLPDDDSLEAYKKRWKTVKKLPTLKKLVGINKLKKDVEADIDDIRSLDDLLKEDIAAVKENIARAQRLPKEQTQKLLSAVGLNPEKIKKISSLLFGEKSQSFVQKAQKTYQRFDTYQEEQKLEMVTPPRGQGIVIHFGDLRKKPDFLVKNILISGKQTEKDIDYNLKGKISNLTHQLSRLLEPTKIQFSAQSSEGASIVGKGIVDHRDKRLFSDSIELKIDQLPLNDITLSKNSKTAVILQRAKADVSSNIQVTNNAIKLNADATFNQARVAIETEKEDELMVALQDSLNTIDRFSLQVDISGTPESPSVEINSDLDKHVSKIFKALTDKKIDQVKEKLTRRLQEKINGELQGMGSSLSDLNNIAKLLNNKKGMLKKIDQ